MLLILALGSTQWTSIKAQNRIPYEFKRFSISDGLPDNMVYGCFQDSEKYMWFLTPTGASRFNGRTFENFTINDGLADNEVLNAYEDSQKRIWFYSFNGKLAFFDIKTNKIESYRTNTTLKEASNKNVVKSIIEDSEQNIWIYYENDIIKVIKKNAVVNNDEIGLLRNKYHFPSGSGILFSNINKTPSLLNFNYLFEFDLTNVKLKSYKELPIEKEVCVAKDGLVYFVTTTGISKWDGFKLESVVDNNQYNKKNIISISLTGHYLWLGTNEGVFGFDLKNRQKSHFFYTGIPVSRVFNDHEDNYWITTMGTGILLMPKEFQEVSIKNKFNGLLENEITCLEYNHQNGDILFAALPNKIYTQKANKNILSTTIDITEHFKINKLKIHYNDLWFITQNKNVHLNKDFNTIHPKSIKISTISKPLSSDIPSLKSDKVEHFEKLITVLSTVKNIYFTKKNVLHIAYSTISNIKFEKNKFLNYYGNNILYNNEKKINEGRIYAITEDRIGRIWFGGTLGIGHNELGNDTSFAYIPSLKFESTINDMCAIGNNALVVSTSGSGIYVVKDEKIIQHILEPQGLSSNNCNKVYKQDDQRVWVATSKGACLIHFSDSSFQTQKITIYGGKNTNPATNINDLLIVKDTLYLATNDGLYSFDVNKVTPQSKQPILKLLAPQLYIDNPSQKLKLNYGLFDNENQINFQFESIAFLNGDYITYQYQLFRNESLVQSDTITQKDKFVLSFSSLTQGNYRLIVSCKRGDNIESEKIISEFEVTPPMWRSIPALLAYILSGGWIVFIILSRANKQSRERKEYLLQQQSEKVRLEGVALEARQKLLELEQESLRARVDPHFIFNCLNGLMSFVYEKDFESIKKLLPRLSRLIRNSLQLGKKDFISINNEKSYLEDYLSLEKMRFEDKFEYNIKIESDVDDLVPIIPPLMLQIFVENAIKHGFKGMVKGKQGLINIHFYKTENAIICEVADNGVGFSKSQSNTINKEHVSLGLDIVKKRISVLNEIHKLNYQLSFIDKNNTDPNETGTEIKLTIPFNNHQNTRND